jgi:hypothetical protein
VDTTTVFELEVAEVFHFKDGKTVFVGPVPCGAKYIPPSQAEVVVNGRVVAAVRLEGEMIPNGRHPKNYRSVSTTDSVPLESASPQEAEVRLRIYLES